MNLTESTSTSPAVAAELALAIVDPPGDGAMLHTGFRTGAEVALTNGAEPQLVTIVSGGM